MAIASYSGSSRGGRSVLGTFVRGYEFVRDSCEARDDHAEGHTVGETNKRSLGWAGIDIETDDWTFGITVSEGVWSLIG